MESWLLEVDQWVANLEDCPELSYHERTLSQSNMNCMGYALSAGKNIQPGEIAMRRQLSVVGPENNGLMRDSFNAHLLVRTCMAPFHFEEDIYESLARDGLEKADGPEDLLQENYYPVALFFTEIPETGRLDFHFLRLNSNSKWSWIPGEGMPVSLHATNPETLEDSLVSNPFKMRWPASHRPDSVWLVPKGGYESLLLPDSVHALSRKSQDIAEPFA